MGSSNPIVTVAKVCQFVDKASNFKCPQVDMGAPISEEVLVAKVASDKVSEAEESQACEQPNLERFVLIPAG